VRWVVLPYLAWTGVYFAMSFGPIGRFSLVKPVGPFANEVHQLAVVSVTGIGHLYYVAMLLELYVLLPVFMWFLRRTAPIHLLLVAVSVAAQIWPMSRVAQSPATNRELWNYQVYLVVGAVVGARFSAVSVWLWRCRRPLGFVVVAVAVATEVLYVRAVHLGTGVGAASDPFQARFIAFNLAAALGLYLLGTWWVAKHRPVFLVGMVKSGADNSYGVYLSQGVALNLLIYWHFGARLEPHLRWPIVALLSLAIVWFSSALLCSILARTPLAWTVGRAQRPLRGAPSAGRFEPRPLRRSIPNDFSGRIKP
jgi:peptidoglycan/LPS O-acetylase OafA/YrhL